MGNPVTTDECTSRKLRVSYARVLVEIDITQATTHETEMITIKDVNDSKIDQRVQYEWVPQYSSTCQRIEHNCDKNKIEVPTPVMKWVEKPKRKTRNSKSKGVVEGTITTSSMSEQPKLMHQGGSSKNDGVKRVVWVRLLCRLGVAVHAHLMSHDCLLEGLNKGCTTARHGEISSHLKNQGCACI